MTDRFSDFAEECASPGSARREDEALRQMEAISRRAPGSIDMRAARAAILWSRGKEAEAEEAWDWACEKINSGELRKGGSVLDGCALYRDADWLLRIRRWPPSVAKKMGDFIELKGQQSAK